MTLKRLALLYLYVAICLTLLVVGLISSLVFCLVGLPPVLIAGMLMIQTEVKQTMQAYGLVEDGEDD